MPRLQLWRVITSCPTHCSEQFVPNTLLLYTLFSQRLGRHTEDSASSVSPPRQHRGTNTHDDQVQSIAVSMAVELRTLRPYSPSCHWPVLSHSCVWLGTRGQRRLLRSFGLQDSCNPGQAFVSQPSGQPDAVGRYHGSQPQIARRSTDFQLGVSGTTTRQLRVAMPSIPSPMPDTSEEPMTPRCGNSDGLRIGLRIGPRTGMHSEPIIGVRGLACGNVSM
ncbi:hypothetical protein QBC46DRAFT_45062 [Diplogelasinospora grovesii]|uniref:Uncharacterized protein n=1 Tax=Diplogelasinospora grovesii TaxID=303347 RepID=A0AAN6MZP6_9PEZI|nr:hypothetical protein QBC46DRAFT_45062 [Diplogelasinospora grovesii]